MPVFPSGEWMDSFCSALAAQPGAGRAADSHAGTYRFVVRPAGALRTTHSYDVTIASGSNGTPEVRWSGGDRVRPTLELSADYERWRQLICGKLNLPMAVMLGRVRIQGDVGGIAGRSADARPLLAALRSVETVWL